MKFAWVENDVIRDVAQGKPADTYHPSVAMLYITQVPDVAQSGWVLIGGTWQAVPAHVPTAEEIAAAEAAAADAAADVRTAAIDEKWEAIKAFRDNRLLTGGYPAGGHWYYSDLIARSQHLANARAADIVKAASGDMNATMLISGITPRVVKSMDNGYMPITANIAHAIMTGAEMHEASTYASGIAHKIALDGSSDPANYDFTIGWPAVFGE